MRHYIHEQVYYNGKIAINRLLGGRQLRRKFPRINEICGL
jgi:hypothetical protein